MMHKSLTIYIYIKREREREIDLIITRAQNDVISNKLVLQ